MKRFLLLLSLPLAIATGCSRTEIENTDPENGSSSLTNPALAWSPTSCEATIGGNNSFPTLSNKYGVSVSYASSDNGVATIDANGAVTLVAAGTTNITASSAATSTYSASSATYVLKVNKGSGGIAWSAVTCTVDIDGQDNSFPTLTNPSGQEIAYSSSNEKVATISAGGSITLLAQGETTITATAVANEAYEASSASYTLVVNGDLASAGLSWSSASYTAVLLADDNAFPTLSNPNNLSVSYSSTNEAIASVDAEGSISLYSEGTVSIIATSEATEVYAAGSASYTLKVVKQDVALSWSEANASVILEEGGTYPTLSVSPEAVAPLVTYSSSNSAVAGIDANGTVTLVKAGSTTISAVFAGNEYYKAATASYSLVVTSNVDDGAGTFTYASTGDAGSDDDISNTTFTRKVTVVYSSTGATVSGYAASSALDVQVSGAQVTITNTGDENIVYELSGTSSNGFFKLYSTKKQAILLNGLNLTCTTGAAINNQSGKRTFVMIEGTNSLSDAASAAYSADSSEDMKAVFFSEGQLVLSGSGSLTVTANNKQGKSGIVSDDYVRVMNNPSIKVTSGSSAGHGLRGKEYVQLSSGTLEISTAANMKKGIGSDDYVLVEGGTATINITGGTAYDSEDGEYTGSAGIKADNYFGMTGGTVTITNSGAGGKGVHAGSYDYDEKSHTVADSYITGGTLSIKTTGSESNDVSSKGIKIGWVTKNGTGDRATVTGYAGNLYISGGKVTVSAAKSEGLEVKGNLVISGGETYVTSSGDDAINSQAELSVTGGYVYAYSSANDAMDANHDLKISGGYVFALTTRGNPEVALDANTEQNYKLYITGGVVVAYGGLERGYSASQNVYSMSCSAGNWNALHNGSSYIAAFKAPSGVSSVVVSAPSLSKGYTGVSVSGNTFCGGVWASSGISGGTSVNLSTYSGGNGGPGGGPGNGGRPW